MSREHHSRFTPSKMSAEQLAATFVQRQSLLDDILDGLRESARSAGRRHMLLIGPRGMGKTHLVSLVFHKAEALAAAEPNLRIAWLFEDETSTSWLDLLVRIWNALAAKYPSEFSTQVVDAARRQKPDDARKSLERALTERLQGKALAVLLENVDELFASIGRDGQHDLRAFLQESRALCLVATAQQFSADVASRESPFFGFFTVEHLKPLDESDAVELLSRFAKLQNDAELAEFLHTAAGHDRVKVVLHLAGGNHRVFIILAEFLNRRDLDELVVPFERLLDELTPYYQARIAWLSPQQRKIVEFLCRTRQPVPVKEIAQALFLTHQGTSSQLKELLNRGYVISARRGRESLYELTEPLMRLCWEVKESRGEPIRLVVDFLRAWYTRDEREALLTECLGPRERYRPYVERSLSDLIDSAQTDPARELTSRPQAGTTDSDTEPPDASPSVLAAWLIDRGIRHAEAGRDDEAVADFARAVELPGAPPERVARALYNRGICYAEAGRDDEAIADFSRAVELPGAPPEQVARALFNRGVFHAEAGRDDEAVADYSRAVELPGAPPEQVARALINRGNRHAEAGRDDEAVADYSRAVELPGAPPEQVARALNNRGNRHAGVGRDDEAVADFARAVELPGASPDEVAWARNGLGWLHLLSGDVEQARDQVGRALVVTPDLPQAVFHAALIRAVGGDWEGGFRDYARALRRFSTSTSRDVERLALLWNLVLDSGRSATLWRRRAGKIVELCNDTALPLSSVGTGLVHSLKRLRPDRMTAEVANDWLDVLRALAREHEELVVPVRLYEVGLRYRMRDDPGVLLDLPSEERRVLTELFGLSDTPG